MKCQELKSKLDELVTLGKQLKIKLEQYKLGDASLTLIDQEEYLSQFVFDFQVMLDELMIDMPISLEKARILLGDDFVGPEEIKATIGLNPSIKIPKIPYSVREIERIRANNERLILRVDRDGENRPLTMDQLILLLDLLAKENGNLVDIDQLKRNWASIKREEHSDSFIFERPETSWKIVSKEGLPSTFNKLLIDQIQILLNWFQDHQFLPEEEIRSHFVSIDKIRQKLGIRGPMLDFQKDELVRALSKNKFFRRHLLSPVELLYDYVVLGTWKTATDDHSTFRTKRYVTYKGTRMTLVQTKQTKIMVPRMVHGGLARRKTGHDNSFQLTWQDIDCKDERLGMTYQR